MWKKVAIKNHIVRKSQIWDIHLWEIQLINWMHWSMCLIIFIDLFFLGWLCKTFQTQMSLICSQLLEKESNWENWSKNQWLFFTELLILVLTDKCHIVTDQIINLFYRLNGRCLSDQSVQQVLNVLHKQKSVGGLQLAVKSITADTALILTDFLQSKGKWEEIRYQ